MSVRCRWMCRAGFHARNLQFSCVTLPYRDSVPPKSPMAPVRDNRHLRRQRSSLAILAGVLMVVSAVLRAENGPDDDIALAPDTSDQRILGVIPNFQTVSDPSAPFAPLSVKDKWKLFAKESYDPFTAGSSLLGAAFSQKGNNDPRYGNGGKAYVQRFGAAMADFTTQNLFSAALLASVLHQDPRYYRMGPRKNLLYRAGYSVSQ